MIQMALILVPRTADPVSDIGHSIDLGRADSGVDTSASALLQHATYAQLDPHRPLLGADDGTDTELGFLGTRRLAGASRGAVGSAVGFTTGLHIYLRS